MRTVLQIAITAALSSLIPIGAAHAGEEVAVEGRLVFSPEDAVLNAVDDFFEAIRNPDKTALREMMVPEGMIFIHNRLNPENVAIVFFPTPDHLAVWERSSAQVDERMTISSINVDGDMAQVWGPYRFLTGGETSHCGINSMSLVETDNDGWKVANTSFSMVPPSECDAIGAPEAW